MRWAWIILLPWLALVSCKKVETSREVGHKGVARVNPYLAAERFLGESGYEVRDALRWPDFDEESPSMVVLPLSVLKAEGFVNELSEWVRWGGHAVVLLDHSESHLGDWDSMDFSWEDNEESAPGRDWLRDLGLEVEDEAKDSASKVELEGREFEVWMESPRRSGGEFVATRELQYGRVTVLADARPLRNRWVGDYDHAALLAWLAEISPDDGPVVFLRFASVSFWKLLWDRAWPAVVGLLVVIAIWLWKNLPRFGPLDSRETGGANLRAAEHHLEALGGFHWQLDRARALLHPLREGLMERGQRLALASGRPDVDLFELLGERAGIGRERAERAMLLEVAKDPASFTRLTADLQSIHQSLP